MAGIAARRRRLCFFSSSLFFPPFRRDQADGTDEKRCRRSSFPSLLSIHDQGSEGHGGGDRLFFLLRSEGGKLAALPSSFFFSMSVMNSVRCVGFSFPFFSNFMDVELDHSLS